MKTFASAHPRVPPAPRPRLDLPPKRRGRRAARAATRQGYAGTAGPQRPVPGRLQGAFVGRGFRGCRTARHRHDPYSKFASRPGQSVSLRGCRGAVAKHCCSHAIAMATIKQVAGVQRDQQVRRARSHPASDSARPAGRRSACCARRPRRRRATRRPRPTAAPAGHLQLAAGARLGNCPCQEEGCGWAPKQQCMWRLDGSSQSSRSCPCNDGQPSVHSANDLVGIPPWWTQTAGPWWRLPARAARAARGQLQARSSSGGNRLGAG